MIFLGTQKLCGGLYILFFFKVSFEKHPNVCALINTVEYFCNAPLGLIMSDGFSTKFFASI